MAKAISRKELNETFRFTLEQMRGQMRDHIQRGEKGAARIIACKIGGAAEFARRLGIIDWEQFRDLQDEAWEAAKHEIEEGGCDEAC